MNAKPGPEQAVTPTRWTLVRHTINEDGMSDLYKVSTSPDGIIRHNRYISTMETDDAERIVAALNAQAAAPPTPATEALIAAGDWPECYEFYELMQTYRHTPITEPINVKHAYEEVKSWLRAAVAQLHPASEEKK